ncbi:uncharacterized protein LOC126606377 [Malus sylvestris]|uniref:Uncharacterized protein n=1 Tax=Malus domestica TaxID=3750 RepID=A0A498HLT2_MALDO|nr:uncharacterized protein LOC126606377 [Malus sylvestris]RXH70131.1 hypothetical protein DVH24_007387 [Malus domestica]
MDIHTNVNLAFEDESAYVDDDDIFFAEIRRQILALTADNEDFPDAKSAKYNSFRSNVTKRPAGHSMSSSLGYISWLENKNSTNYAVPASLAKLWENSDVTGTGVFIPQAVKSRRDCRPRRMNDRRKTYKRVENLIKHS